MNKSLNQILVFLVISVVWVSCAPSRAIMPLCKKENLISASVGGPIIHLGKAVTPIPFSTVTYSRGITDSITLFASFHPTAAIYGNFQMEIGLNTFLYNNDSTKMAVTIAPSINYIRKDSINKVYPQIDANFIRRNPHNENYYYAGISAWFEIAQKRLDGTKQPLFILPNLQFGYCINTKKGWGFQAEFKYLVPFKRNDNTVVEYVKPFVPYGAMGLYLGASYKF